MNKLMNRRVFVVLVLALALVFASCTCCFAAENASTAATSTSEADLTNAVQPIVTLLNSFLKPLIAVVGAVGVLYCVVLGVKYARAEEPQDREKAKAHLKSAIIGFVLIFILMVALNQLIGPLLRWAQSYGTSL